MFRLYLVPVAVCDSISLMRKEVLQMHDPKMLAYSVFTYRRRAYVSIEVELSSIVEIVAINNMWRKSISFKHSCQRMLKFTSQEAGSLQAATV